MNKNLAGGSKNTARSERRRGKSISIENDEVKNYITKLFRIKLSSKWNIS